MLEEHFSNFFEQLRWYIPSSILDYTLFICCKFWDINGSWSTLTALTEVGLDYAGIQSLVDILSLNWEAPRICCKDHTIILVVHSSS